MSLSTPSHSPQATSFPPSVTEQPQLVGSPSIRLLSESLPSGPSPGGTSHGSYNGLKVAQGHRNECTQGKRYGHVTTISMLPDDVLLEIFDVCQNDLGYWFLLVWQWHLLVHVCRRWRQIVFASPHRLNLQILCTHKTPFRKNLDIWPTLPIVIGYYFAWNIERPVDMDNIIAALDNTNRVSRIRLHVTGPELQMVAAVMQEPFPALKRLCLMSEDWNAPVVPGEFLGRSAPCLQEVCLNGIPFPELPILLPSASRLTSLKLLNIPYTGYISPEAMVVGLATLTRLRSLHIEFRSSSPNSHPDQIRQPSIARIVLPALTSFSFSGVHKYLEDFAAQIDASRLDSIVVRYSNWLVGFQVPQLSRLINHSENLRRPMSFSVRFRHYKVCFVARPIPGFRSAPRCIDVCFQCGWQETSRITQALGRISAVLSNIVYFAISWCDELPRSKLDLEGMDNIDWLQLLHPFISVQTMTVCVQFAGYIAYALEGATREMATEVLPALDLLWLEDQPVSSVDKFTAVRRDSGCPVTIANSKTEFEERIKTYI